MAENHTAQREKHAHLRRCLLRWYDRHKRDLPWRALRPGDANPYHVLVSEAMLQQTQVVTVIPYFHRFIERFPTVADLAAADEQQVLRLWQGLGYYRRARHLHAAARHIMSEHAGQIPCTAAALLKLPGIGRYSAGAIASIAFGERAPILDGNVARVLSRWFAIDEPIDESAVRDRLWSLAEELVPAGRAGDFNQAMMELGATVCTPRGPACLRCPVAKRCAGYQAGRAESLPVRLARRRPREVVHVVAAIERDGRWLFQQRPGKGLWSNLWQLPTLEAGVEEPVGEQLAPWIEAELGVRVRVCRELESFTHQTTHRTIRFRGFHLRVCGGRLKPDRGVWRKPGQLDDLPLSNPQRRIVGALPGC